MWTLFAMACGVKNKQCILYSKESGKRPSKKKLKQKTKQQKMVSFQ